MNRTQKIVTFSVAGAVVGLVGLGWLTYNANEIRKEEAAGPVSVTEDSLPAGFDNGGGVSVGTSGVVGADLVETGTVPTVDVYFDFACSHCATFESAAGPDLEALGLEGEAQVIYHPISILDRYSEGTEYSTRSAAASFTVAEFAPEFFLDFNAVLFDAQGSMPPSGLSDDEMASIAQGLGVPADVTDTFGSDMYEGWTSNSTEKASIAGVAGTPSVAVNGELLDYTQVNYMEPGVLLSYIESLG